MPESLQAQLEARMAARAEKAPQQSAEQELEAHAERTRAARPEPEPEPEPENEPEPEQEPEGDEPEGDEPEGEPEPEGDEPEGSEPQRYTPKALAEAIGWSAEDLYNSLEIPLGGKGERVTLGEVKDRFARISQEEERLQQARTQIEQEVTALQQRQQQIVDNLQKPADDVIAAQARVQQIKDAYANMDWDELRKQGGDVADTKLQFSAAFNEAKQKLAEAEEKVQESMQQVQQQTAGYHFQQLLAEPEFKELAQDEGKFREQMEQLHQFAVNVIGFKPEELNGVVHHKAIKTLLYAMRGYQALQQQQKTADKIRQAPKPVMRPGGGQTRSREAAKLDDVITRGKRRGASQREKRDAAKAVFAKRLAKG